MNVWMEGITMRQQLRSHTHTLTHAAVPYYRFTSYTLYGPVPVCSNVGP